LTTVRIATPSDIDTLVELMRQFYAESDFPLDRDWAANAFSELIAEPTRGAVWLLGVDGHPVGHAVLTVRFAMEFGGLSAYIDDLFVQAAHRRQGIARAGLDALVAEAIRRGCKSLHVEVAPTNVAATTLYSRFGLVPGTDERQQLKTELPTAPR
jgi:GNAT superfamily N-acetyltransferase